MTNSSPIPWPMATQYQVVLEAIEFKNGRSYDQTIATAWSYQEALQKRDDFIATNQRWKHFSIVIKSVIN